MIDVKQNEQIVSVGYVRVSTTENRQKLGFDVQKRKLNEIGIDYLYSETMSGRKDERPEFNKAIKQAKCLAARGNKVIFVVYKLDRLARKMSTILSTLEDLQKAGVSFKSLTENVDTSTATGTLMMQLLGMFSEFEVNTTRARIKEALKQARLEGKILGRPPMSDKTKRNIASLYQNASLPVEAIAKRFHISVRTVYRVAKNSGISRRV